MRMYDVIRQKQRGLALTEAEIRYFVEGYTKGEIPDYQAAALCMAIYFQGMTDAETAVLTMEMARSGDMVDLSALPGTKVDKHSTGGVGDKTSLVIGPIAAACGVTVAKMSGRGLGHTGGTLDKLESIPGCQVSLSEEKFQQVVRDTGLCIIGQTGNIAPADKKLYALRDVTATVESIPLIAASIMSKKLASGADAILLDVKCGSGAFMKTKASALKLAQEMVNIGVANGRKMAAMITDMDLPLGNAIGNSLEVMEAVETLQGRGPADFTELCLELSAMMLVLGGRGSLDMCRGAAKDALQSGAALEKLFAMISAQGGDAAYLRDLSKFPKTKYVYDVIAPTAGYIVHMDAESIGGLSVTLGAGRAKKEDGVDYAAGILLRRKTGDTVNAGNILATLYTNKPELNKSELCQAYLSTLQISSDAPEPENLILARIESDG